jgi:hypothetical protein
MRGVSPLVGQVTRGVTVAPPASASVSRPIPAMVIGAMCDA